MEDSTDYSYFSGRGWGNIGFGCEYLKMRNDEIGVVIASASLGFVGETLCDLYRARQHKRYCHQTAPDYED